MEKKRIEQHEEAEQYREASDEQIRDTAERILERYRSAFEELAK